LLFNYEDVKESTNQPNERLLADHKSKSLCKSWHSID